MCAKQHVPVCAPGACFHECCRFGRGGAHHTGLYNIQLLLQPLHPSHFLPVHTLCCVHWQGSVRCSLNPDSVIAITFHLLPPTHCPFCQSTESHCHKRSLFFFYLLPLKSPPCHLPNPHDHTGPLFCVLVRLV